MDSLVPTLVVLVVVGAVAAVGTLCVSILANQVDDLTVRKFYAATTAIIIVSSVSFGTVVYACLHAWFNVRYSNHYEAASGWFYLAGLLMVVQLLTILKVFYIIAHIRSILRIDYY